MRPVHLPTCKAALLIVSVSFAGTLAQQHQTSSGLAGRIDHVMYTGGPELVRLVEILRDKLLLPVVFDGPKQTPALPGTCFSFGNTCLEVVPLRPAANEPPRPARIGSLALEARAFGTLVDSLDVREIDHFPPAAQARWTTVGLRGFGGGTFFIEYHAGMSQRRTVFREELDRRQGGLLGIVRMVEISRVVDLDPEEMRRRLTRLFGDPSPNDASLWPVGDGPALRLVTGDESRVNRVVVEVRGIAAAAAALRNAGLAFAQTKGEIAIDPAALLGLRLILVEPVAPPD